jgi:PPOX class probable F420-dependent enzyme
MRAHTGQRRGGSVATLPDERDAFLRDERTCRLSTVGTDGRPHVSALWFVWDGEAFWVNSLTRSKRWADIRNDPRVSILVDAGHNYSELRGVELSGTVEPVCEIPRVGKPNPVLQVPEQMFAAKYGDGHVGYDGRHGWLRLRPTKIVSWDFRKISK